MKRISDLILKYKYFILLFFIVVTIISLFMLPKVKVNYNFADYLPRESESLKASEEVMKYYNSNISNVKLMLKNVNFTEAFNYKQKLLSIEGVEEVLWADNYYDITNLENQSIIEDWYKNNNSLYMITIDTADSKEVINDIKNSSEYDILLSGDAVNITNAQQNIPKEINKIIFYAVPIILIILILTTSSWFEPILFIFTIGISILINMGTNIIFDEISSITQAAAAVLQLAVSMDYAIFLLLRFAVKRHSGKDVEYSMKEAMNSSLSTIFASALTTIFGFLALVVMKFEIGADLGLVLAKGITISFITVFTLLPILSMLTYKIIDKTHHKSLIPSFNNISKFIYKIRYVVFIIIILIIIPCFIASQKNSFLYGSTGINSKDSEIYKDTQEIEEEFGLNNQMILLIPKNDLKKEQELEKELLKNKEIISITSFVSTFGINTPIEYLPENIVSNFISEKYSRIIINTNLEEEGKETFNLVENIKNTTEKYFKNYHFAGVSVTNYDLKNIITYDNLIVNIIAIVSILIILIISFKSIIIPLILVVSIETAIWINLSINYLIGDTLNYIGFLIVSTVQLGATVDYAILFAKKYLINKKKLDKKEALIETLNETSPSILSSAIILAIAGFGLGLISSNGVINELGILVGRGALISSLIVLFFTSAFLSIINKYLKK